MLAPRWSGRTLVGILIVGALLACAPGSGTAPAAPSEPARASTAASPAGGAPPAGLAALVEQARREGQINLVWSENTAGGGEGARQWIDGLNRRHGLNLTAQFTPGPPMPEVAARIAQEYVAGRPATTDVLIGSEAHIVAATSQDALLPVDWAAWAPNVQNPALVAPGGVAVQFASRLPGITYHSGKVVGDAIPVRAEDMLQPRYKGRIASTSYAANFDRLASPELWGEQRTLDYVTKLSDQLSGLIRCGQMERLLSGEFDFLVLDCGSYDALRMQAQGAPLGHVVPAEAAVITYWYLAVPRNAPHAAAAQLFIDYAVSPEGQALLYATDYSDHHLVPGSRTAEEIQKFQARGVRFTELNVEFVLRNDEKQTARLRDELQRILAKK